ncbi:MAG: TonB-dependent receptor [Bryobacteraceae bacterium]|nr:TonB-dependent receptor [Bryobacterales bacterium]NUN03010.1 TonB-dependent receptor [Bryobacteraceae bacterium]
MIFPFRAGPVFTFLSLCMGLGAQTVAPAGSGPAAVQSPPAKPAQNAARPSIGASAQRNENVAIYQIDNNAVKESNIRLGSRATVVTDAPVEVSYYATEHGQSASELVFLAPVPAPSIWHGELYHSHQNSIFNARTFFQVGPVMPSRRNFYGGRFTSTVPVLGALTVTADQRKVRGMVNGNVLVPLASERQPLTEDPQLRRIISRFLEAYPNQLPNRLDFDPRALNTNAPQTSDDTDVGLRIDRPFTNKNRISASHVLTRRWQHAFQLVAGQNPDTEIHTHRSRLTWERIFSEGTQLSLGFSFNRTRSLLLSEPNAVGPRVRFGYQIEELGPDSQFPINRAQNAYRWGALFRRQPAGSSHLFTLGGDITRYQLNGVEANNQRGYFQFTNNFGRTAIQNLLVGTPSLYEVTIGDLYRAFRSSSANLFFADKWSLSQRFQLYFGLRYSLEGAPTEVRRANGIPYGCDCNNFSPRFSLAYRATDHWTARAAYNVSFGQILPVTYQQVRNNLPLVRYVQVQNPDLIEPLRNVDLSSGRTSPTLLAPDLVSPYAHQYSFTLERPVGKSVTMRLGYLGSRSLKLINVYITNRAVPVEGIPLTTATVDQRRPDPHLYEVNNIVNGGIAYFDAGQLTVTSAFRSGLAWSATYTFGKAIDEGPDYTFTAANRDLTTGRSQWQYDSLKDKKGLSTFDSTHSLTVAYSYELPSPAAHTRIGRAVLGGWQISGMTLLKTGTPLTLFIGSDGPGYGNVDGGPSDRPNILDPSILGMTISNPDVAPRIITRDRFAYITPGENRGSLGRNTFRKAGIANLNAALTKELRWRGAREWAALLRIEAYNLANHPQFDEPQRNLSSPAFGKITNTLNDGRVLQVGLRIVL